MRIEFDRNGGAKFIIFEHNEDGSDNHDKPIAADTMSWIEVLRIGNELVNRAKQALVGIQLGDVGVIGRASVSDPPAKAESDGP